MQMLTSNIHTTYNIQHTTYIHAACRCYLFTTYTYTAYCILHAGAIIYYLIYYLLVGHRLVAGTYKSSGHDHQLVSTVQ
jgi:hypothetical protein